MSLLDAFFNKGFKAAKCKTFLKLTIPRIKLLRNRREIQIKQMRRDIAKLLETGQEATARIRVEHIVREENMMAAQEIIELFSELISVRLPIIETQRECPLDLKEAISSLCFAAPRCADLPELLQVQILFASKYGKEFVAAATELMPDCGVNRQLVELLSVRAPSPERKIKLLKEIAEEHEVEWDPEPSETEFLKRHEDLLNGPTQFVSGSTLPLPKEKHDGTLNSATNHSEQEHSDSETGSEAWDFPEVPKAAPLRPTPNVASAPEIVPAIPSAFHPEVDHDSSNHSATSDYLSPEPHTQHKDVTDEEGPSIIAGMKKEEKQYVPFMSPPSVSPASLPARKSASPPPSVSRTKGDANEDLQDVISAAHTAAESAERAAAAARSAATLAQARISELTKKNSDQFPENGDENPFYTDTNQSPTADTPQFDHQQSFSDHDSFSGDAYQTQHPTTDTPHFDHQQSFSDHDDSFSGDRYQTAQHPTSDDTPQFDHQQSFSDHDSFSGDPYQSQHPTTDSKPQFDHQQSFSDVDSFSADPNPTQHSEDQHDIPSFDKLRVQYDSPTSNDRHADQGPDLHQPQRLPSMEDEPYFYPNLFTPQNSNPGSNAPSSTDKSRSTHEP